MGTAAHCAWCFKPMVDADHARKHVLEQCEKAPWREALITARREAASFKLFMAVLVHRMGGDLLLSHHEIENLPLGELTVKEDGLGGDVRFIFELKKQGA